MRKERKIIIGIFIALMLCGLYLTSCATPPSPAYSTDSSGGAGSSAQMPAWFTKPYSVVPEGLFVAATGTGSSTEDAQYKARVALLQVFKVDIANETVIQELFQENTVNGVTNWSNAVAMESKISASAAGILSGCEIRENQAVGGSFYALAVMDKSKTINIYTDIISRLASDINEALNIPEKNTFDGYTRYLLAANIAKDIGDCVSVLRFVGGSGSIPAGLKSENEYKIEANNIIKTIPVRISVTKTPNSADPTNRVQAAFAKAIGDIGFQSGGSGSRYALDVNVSIEPVPMPGTNVFSRITVTANLTDTATRTVIVPFNFDTREGHNSQANADNRAIMAAESRINSEFKPNLEAYISNLSRSK